MTTKLGRAIKISKRCLDVSFVLIGVIVLSPLLVLVSLVIKLNDGGPVLFKQLRIGYKGKPFHIYKYRTMVVNAERLGKKITVGADERVTWSGRWLRKYKIDELPQLFNVLKGDMALIGPRPEVPEYVALYSEEQRKVLDLVPGITDPASLKYRHESDILATSADPERDYIQIIMPEKIRINVAYSKEATILRDISILLHTLIAVTRRHNYDLNLSKGGTQEF